MNIGFTIAGGYTLLLFLLLGCGGVGYCLFDVLSRNVAFLSGPAWNTADGALEGSIETEAQMIAAGNAILVKQPEDNQAQLQVARGRGDEPAVHAELRRRIDELPIGEPSDERIQEDVLHSREFDNAFERFSAEYGKPRRNSQLSPGRPRSRHNTRKRSGATSLRLRKPPTRAL